MRTQYLMLPNYLMLLALRLRSLLLDQLLDKLLQDGHLPPHGCELRGKHGAIVGANGVVRRLLSKANRGGTDDDRGRNHRDVLEYLVESGKVLLKSRGDDAAPR